MIRILERDNNRRGDLFGRLMADLFVALGYEQPQLNVHKSGRELDLVAYHLFEPRRAIGECKATVQPIGGDDLNKFVGVLDAEHKAKRPVTGYFISLSGFTETALLQERKRRRTKIITLGGTEVIDALVKGRIVIAKERATELAGRSCSTYAHLVLDDAELLAHERGWIWAVYYMHGKARTNFALIHSDGTPLARAICEEVIAADQSCGGGLHQLSCLNPEPSIGSSESQVQAARTAYRQYLLGECGYIQLDGLPADGNVDPHGIRLESLFVPLHLDITLGVGEAARKLERRPVGTVLAKYARIALLAAPGGGKSTLIKRLAVAYADAERHRQVKDELPRRDWLPLFFRCRELRGMARGSFADLLTALAQREPVRQYADAFRTYVDRELLAGRVLLLVDGLDEISDAGDRAAFVCTIRSVIQAYPGIAVVVTSREAGFRHVAAHLAPVCTRATLSVFNADDIRRLSVAWHREVVGDTEKVRTDAEELATTISGNDRIQRLAVNPLLLTTLLLVKRWVGSLPTRRAVLYGKAVEVLLMTWNTEGHDPIPEGEALPQLCYLASSMMLDGVQKISRPKLASLLQAARGALPTELGYVKGEVEEFIHRVEDRSSLLMMTGYDVEDGQLVEFFEFRHLTFQEFLAAKAMVEGWHPGRSENDSLVSVLEPHFGKEQWREVIPLAAVLGGKETESLIKRLTEKIGEYNSLRWISYINDTPLLALSNCLADEAAARPDTIRAAIRQLVRLGGALEFMPHIRNLSRGKYGADLREEAGKSFMSKTHLRSSSSALAQAVWWQTIESMSSVGFLRAAVRFNEMLRDPERLIRCEGALGCMFLCFSLHGTDSEDRRAACAEALREAGPALSSLLFSEDICEQYASAWALAWLGECWIWPPPSEPDVLGHLFAIWRHSPNDDLRSRAAWALGNQKLMPRGEQRWCASIPEEEVRNLFQGSGELGDSREKSAVLVVAWYLNIFNDKELIRLARQTTYGESTRASREILMLLGERVENEDVSAIRRGRSKTRTHRKV